MHFIARLEVHLCQIFTSDTQVQTQNNTSKTHGLALEWCRTSEKHIGQLAPILAFSPAGNRLHHPEGIWHKVRWKWWKNRELEKRLRAAGMQQALPSAWGHGRVRRVFQGRTQGHWWVVGQEQAGPHKVSGQLAEGWEVCISSASLSDENTMKSSLLHCSAGPRARLCAASKSSLR